MVLQHLCNAAQWMVIIKCRDSWTAAFVRARFCDQKSCLSVLLWSTVVQYHRNPCAAKKRTRAASQHWQQSERHQFLQNREKCINYRIFSVKSSFSWPDLVSNSELLNLYKELKHSLHKTYEGNASIPYIKSTVTKTSNCYKFFFRSKKFQKKYFRPPRSIGNFPRNPKITLIKSPHQAK